MNYTNLIISLELKKSWLGFKFKFEMYLVEYPQINLSNEISVETRFLGRELVFVEESSSSSGSKGCNSDEGSSNCSN